VALLLKKRASIGMLFVSSSGPTRYDGMRATNCRRRQAMFSIGDIVTIKGRSSSHVGYVTEVVPTKTMKGEMPTIIVEWFGSDSPIRRATVSWHFEDELIKVVPTSEGI